MGRINSLALVAILSAIASGSNPLPQPFRSADKEQPATERREKLDKAAKKRLKRQERNRKLAAQQEPKP